jgi:ABC-type uncharacterized transport system fused permease/ATPase subunit
MVNPHLYFELEKLRRVIIDFSVNLWRTFEKYADSTSLSYAEGAIKKLIQSVYNYEELKANQQGFSINHDLKVTLSVKDLCISYPALSSKADTNILFSNLNRKFQPGRLYAVVGESGSGKSSFFNTLYGVNPYATGEINITHQQNIIYVPQNPSFKQGLNWLNTLLYPALSTKFSNEPFYEELLSIIDRYTEDLALNHVKRCAETSENQLNWTTTLSGGEAQRVALLQMFIKVFLKKQINPEANIVLLLDEPLSALDEKNKSAIFNLLKKIVEKYNITALQIDHSSEDVILTNYGEHVINFGDLEKKRSSSSSSGLGQSC